MVKKGTKPEIKTAEKPELVSAEVEESADEDIQQDFKFCVKTHKRKILMFQMELVAVSKEFRKIKNNVKDDNLKLFEGKVLALEQHFSNCVPRNICAPRAYVKCSAHVRTWREAGGQLPPKFPKFGQNSNVSGSDKKIFGQNKNFSGSDMKNLGKV